MARVSVKSSQGRKPRKRAQAVEGEHQLRQRKHILTHAARLFAEMGYAATTMDTLSAVTKMNKASLYYYFESKQDILYVLLSDATMMALDLAAPAAKMRTATDGIIHLIQAGMKSLYSGFDEHRIFMQELPYFSETLSAGQYRGIMRMQRDYMKMVYEVINRGIKSGEFKDGNVRLLGSLFVSWVNAPYSSVGGKRPEEMTKALADLFLHGLRADPEPRSAEA